MRKFVKIAAALAVAGAVGVASVQTANIAQAGSTAVKATAAKKPSKSNKAPKVVKRVKLVGPSQRRTIINRVKRVKALAKDSKATGYRSTWKQEMILGDFNWAFDYQYYFKKGNPMGHRIVLSWKDGVSKQKRRFLDLYPLNPTSGTMWLYNQKPYQLSSETVTDLTYPQSDQRSGYGNGYQVIALENYGENGIDIKQNFLDGDSIFEKSIELKTRIPALMQ